MHCLGYRYVALNETARELEMPFGLDANDLALTLYQKEFNQKLAQLLDLTIPELGYNEQPDHSGLDHLAHGYSGSPSPTAALEVSDVESGAGYAPAPSSLSVRVTDDDSLGAPE